MRAFMMLLATAMSACAADVDLPPLLGAARRGDVAQMTALIDAGADINARDARNRFTPLLHAVHAQQEDAVRLLLARGADPNAGYMPPLAMAALGPNGSIVETLIEYGADVSVRGPRGASPLSMAVSGGAMTDVDVPILGSCHPATVQAFMDYDPTLRIGRGPAAMEALWWARFHGCEDVIAMIGEAPTKPGQTIVAFAGIVHERLRGTRHDAPQSTPATADPDRR
jgi:Ankyrin repeats (3 copies)